MSTRESFHRMESRDQRGATPYPLNCAELTSMTASTSWVNELETAYRRRYSPCRKSTQTHAQTSRPPVRTLCNSIRPQRTAWGTHVGCLHTLAKLYSQPQCHAQKASERGTTKDDQTLISPQYAPWLMGENTTPCERVRQTCRLSTLRTKTSRK